MNKFFKPQMVNEKLAAIVLIGVFALSLYSAVEIACSVDAVLEQVSEIIKEVQEIRGLKFKEQPRIVVITRAEAMRLFSSSPAENRIEELMYKMTLLLPGNYSFQRAKEEQSAGWIAVTLGNTVYIIEENFKGNPAMAKRALAHELVHVLQRQWFDARYEANTFDGTLAVQALVEGDADLVADIYCLRKGIPIYKIRSLSGDPLTDLHIFPYVFGDSFVRYLYEKGNWTLVNEAYQHYPETALQVMIPEYYLENRTPENVTIAIPKGWKVLRNDRMGAFYVYVLLRDVAKLDNATAWNVSADWLGDRLILANNGTDHVLLWEVMFGSENAAELFAETLKKLAEDNTYATFKITREDKIVTLKAVRRVGVEA